MPDLTKMSVEDRAKELRTSELMAELYHLGTLRAGPVVSDQHGQWKSAILAELTRRTEVGSTPIAAMQMAKEAIDEGVREWGKRDCFLLPPEKIALAKMRAAQAALAAKGGGA